MMNCINEVHQQFPYYGYRKIHWSLKNYGYKNNIKKTQRLVQEMCIQAIYPGPKTSMPSDNGSVFPYLIKDIIIIRAKSSLGYRYYLY
jgi:putative transposase